VTFSKHKSALVDMNGKEPVKSSVVTVRISKQLQVVKCPTYNILPLVALRYSDAVLFRDKCYSKEVGIYRLQLAGLTCK
jgi:hypothetical protein